MGIAFPWAGIRARDHGSAQRIGLLIDFLQERVDTLTVLAPWEDKDFLDGNASYVRYVPTLREQKREQIVRRLIRFAVTAVSRSSVAPGEEYWLWRHLEHRFTPSLMAALERLVDSSDVVLTSFSFWCLPLSKIARRKGVPVIVTTHDVISDQVQGNSLLYKLTRWMEIRSLASADHRFSSSEQDQRSFQERGISTEIVRPGVDLSRPQALPPETLMHWRRELALPQAGKLCLFVGTTHPPNLVALQQVRSMARAVEDAGHPGISFVIAGNVASPERAGNLIALGRIEEAAIDALYQLADLVLVPLLTGTGTSRKTLEALAFGKAVIGTGVGFRGIPVQTGVDGIVCDDLQRYPATIVELLGDDELRQRLGRNARELAGRFDYRRVYERYLEIMQR